MQFLFTYQDLAHSHQLAHDLLHSINTLRFEEAACEENFGDRLFELSAGYEELSLYVSQFDEELLLAPLFLPPDIFSGFRCASISMGISMAAIRVFRSVRRKTAALMFLPQVIDSDNLVAATENPGLEFHVPQEDSVTEENIETERFNLYARHTFDVGLFKLTMPSLPEIIEGEFSYNDFLYLSHLLLGEYARAQDRRLLQRLPPRLKFEDGSLVPIYEGEWFDEYRKEHPEGCQFEHPKWDSKNHRLWYKGREARIVAKQAHRVREILDAFEAHRWISPIKFPRRNRFDNEPAAILKAVNQLNDDLRYLVFKATSSSEVISWSPRENSEELLKNSL